MASRPDGRNLSVALVHYPVYDKNRNIVKTALTNLDLHDIARSAKTYGLHSYYVVTPLEDQKDLAKQIMGHWQQGWGASYNIKRKEALDLVKAVDSLDDAIKDMEAEFGREVFTIATAAKETLSPISFRNMSRLIDNKEQPYLLLLGTGWGLTDQVLEDSDFLLEPIRGCALYNHLSVRSASAIIMDRLLSQNRI
jgi:hypothetical protein